MSKNDKLQITSMMTKINDLAKEIQDIISEKGLYKKKMIFLGPLDRDTFGSF